MDLSRSVDRCNRVVERFLVHQVLVEGVLRGRVDSRTLVGWMLMEGIQPPPKTQDVYTWAGVQLSLATRNGVEVFRLEQVGRSIRWSLI